MASSSILSYDNSTKSIKYYYEDHKTKVKLMLSQDTSKQVVKKVSYRKDLIAIFNTDPFLCECGHYLEYIDYWVPPTRRNGVAYDDST